MDIFRMIVYIDIIRPNVNMRSMTDRDKYILDAAVRLFSRYGVKRTSMGDLAEEAGVARQTLYNAYKNKDDVLRALIRYHTDMAIDEIEAGLDGVQALGDQLDIIFNRMSVAGFKPHRMPKTSSKGSTQSVRGNWRPRLKNSEL
jgi:AcrR family transcriptional regulator